MTVALRSLRVSAEMNAADYTAGARALEQSSTQASTAVQGLGASVQGVDSKVSSTGSSLHRLRSQIDPAYASLARFEQGVRLIGASLDKGTVDMAEAERMLGLLSAKYQQTADASRLSAIGHEQMAMVAESVNARLAAESAALDVNTSALLRNSSAAKAQQAAETGRQIAEANQSHFNNVLGVHATSKGGASETAAVFAAEFDRLDEIARLRAQQAADGFVAELNGRLVPGLGKSARDAAAVFAAELDRVEEIARLKAQQAGQSFHQALDASFGIGNSGSSARASAAVFEDAAREADQMAARAGQLRAQIDPLGTALSRLNVELAENRSLAAAGAISAQELTAAQALAEKQFLQTADAIMRQNKAGAANDNLVRGRRQGLMFQTFDIGTTLAGGMNPALIAAQQGPQLVQLYAGNGGVNAALKDMIGLLGGAARAMGPLAVVAGVAAAGVFGLQQAIQDATGEAVSFGDTFQAVFQVIGGYIYDELKPAIDAIAPYFASAWEMVKAATAETFNLVIATAAASVAVVGAGARSLYEAFLAAYDTISMTWERLPQALGDITIQAAQAVLDGTESMVNGAIAIINNLIETANVAITALGGTAIETLSTVDFGAIMNPWEGQAAASAEAVQKRWEEAFAGIEKLFKDANTDAKDAFGTDFAGRFFDDVAQQSVKNMQDRLRDLKKEARDAKGAANELRREFEAFEGRADNLLEKMFPGEAARREAHELLGLLDKFGGKLDDFQRKAVEGRVDELFLAASLGMRDLGNETDKTGDKFGELKEKAQSVGDALKEGFSSFLQDLFTGRDVLESIVQLGSRFASMNFDALVEGVSGYFGGGTQSSTGRFPAAPAKAVGKIIGTEIVDVVKTAVDPWSGMRATSDGVGSYTSARAVGQTMAQGVNPVLSKALNPIGVEISKAAAELGVSARDLGTLISYETKGTFSTKVMGGHGGNYLGLIQFGPEERQKYGAYWGQAFGDQMQAAVRYFKDRGLQPGMGIRDLYSTILTGSPGNYNRTDGYGTVDEHLTRMAAHQAKADAVLAGLPEAVKAGSTAGTRIGGREGIKSGVQEIGSAATGAPGGKASGFDAFAGLFGAALGGFSTGFQSGNVGMGVLGGGLQGLGAGMQLASLFPAMGMALPVIGAVVGGVAGLVGAIMGAKKKLKQAQDALQDNMKAIDALLAIGEGRGVGRIQKRLTDYLGEIDKAVDLAWKAKNMDLVKRLQESFNLYWAREARDFETGFQGMIRAYKSGRGEDDSYLQGQRAMEDLREEVRGLIADVRYFGEQRIALSPNLSDDMRALLEQRLSDELAAVTEASKRMVLAMIAGTEEMSEMERNVQSLQGAADAAQVVLEELGMSARAAAEAIDKQLNAAMAKLAAQYIEDVSRSIYDLADLGVFNDLLDAQQRYNDRLRDAAALGISADLANRELALSLRSIVKETNLTDDQIRQLAAALPMLSGGLLSLLGLSEGGDTAKALADAQAKVEEAKASLRSAYEKERSELDSTISRLKSFTDSIRTFKDSLKLDKELSPLDARERLAEAQRQFEEVSAQAMGTGPGAEAAQGRLEEVSRAYLEEARAYYGSNEMYYAIWKQVDATLDAALAKAGTQLSTAELQLAQLKAQVGALIDVDDSVKSVEDAIAELKKAQDAETAAKAADDAYKNALFAEMVELLKAQLAADEAAKAAAAAAATVSTATYSSSDPVANLYRSVLGREPDAAGYAFYSGNLNAGITSLASIEAELRRQAGSIGMASGGMVNGGVPGTDSVLRMLMPGEFVMPAAATRRHEGDLWAMRSGQYGASNDNGVVAAIQRLTDQVRELERSNADLLARLTAVTATGFSQTVSATNRTGDAMEQQGREQALQSRKRQAA